MWCNELFKILFVLINFATYIKIISVFKESEAFKNNYLIIRQNDYFIRVKILISIKKNRKI